MKHLYLKIHDIYPALLLKMKMERKKIENVRFINKRGESSKKIPGEQKN